MKTAIYIILLAAWGIPNVGETMVVDSFVVDNLNISLAGNQVVSTQNTSPIGTSRIASIGNRTTGATGSVFDCYTDAILELLVMDVSGDFSMTTVPSLVLTYHDQSASSLTGFNALEFDFSEVLGAGYLVVEVGVHDGDNVPDYFKTPIQNGVINLPFSQIQQDSGSTLDFFPSLHISFIADNGDLSFQLGEIRAVPEPSSLLLLLGGAGFLWLRRMKKRG